MNYEFAAATIAFSAGERVSQALVEDRSYQPYPGIDAVKFGLRIQRMLNTNDWETNQVQFNLLDSHDTPRLLSIARGDKATVRLATLFQMTFPGTPCIYYGDEIGLRGSKRYDRRHRDQDARWPFPWEDQARWDQQMLQFFRQAITLRQTHSVFRDGAFEQLHAAGQQYAFVRQNAIEKFLVVLNAADGPASIEIPVRGIFTDGEVLHSVLGPEATATAADNSLAVAIPKRTGMVLGMRPITRTGAV